MMKVKCISNKVGLAPGEEGNFNVVSLPVELISLIVGNEYEVLNESDGFYQLIDESGEIYWHPVGAFSKV